MNVLPINLKGDSQKLKSKYKALEKAFNTRHNVAVTKLLGDYEHHVKALLETEVPVKSIGSSTAKLLSAGVLAGALVLNPLKPQNFQNDGETASTNVANAMTQDEQTRQLLKNFAAKDELKKALATQLQNSLPGKLGTLSPDVSEQVSRILMQTTGINAVSELDGKRLNTDYGMIGAEQHLLRYPGDSIAQHDDLQQSGIAPRKGAFGYFAKSASSMTEDEMVREKYYFAVQTFRSPDWNQNVYQLKEWFKFRKVVAVNTKTGDVVVGVIGDAGPAVWTGKQFGGSPEVMRELHLDKGMRKGEVILFFVDDPGNVIPLGPVK